MKCAHVAMSAFVLGMGIGVGNACGAAPSAAELRAWLEGEVAKSQEYPPIDGLYVEYTVEVHDPLDTAKLVVMRNRVEGHPDHPLRADYEQYQHYAEYGPRVEHKRVWSRAAGSFRYSQDRDDEFLPYHDIVVVDDHAWQMTNLQVYLLDPRKGFPPQLNLEMYERGGFSRDLTMLVTGGLNTISVAPVTQDQIRLLDEVFEGVMGLDDEASARVRGYWSSDEDRWFIRELMHLTSANPESIGRRLVFSEWTKEPLLGTWIAARMEEIDSDGAVRRVLRFDSVRALDDREFERVTAMPELGGNDEVRGVVEATSLRDYRPSRPIAYKYDDTAQVVSAPLLAPGQNPGQPAARKLNVRMWQIIGWSIAGALALLAIGFRYGFWKR